MTTNPALPDLAQSLRRLLEGVKEACCVEGRWGWLAGPMALLTWLRTRRERREAALAMAAFQGLVEQLLSMLEDFRAGRLAAEAKPEGVAPELAEPFVALRSTADVVPRRCSASSAASEVDRGEREGAQRGGKSGDCCAPLPCDAGAVAAKAAARLANSSPSRRARPQFVFGPGLRRRPRARPAAQSVLRASRAGPFSKDRFQARGFGAPILLLYRNDIHFIPGIIADRSLPFTITLLPE